MGAGAGSRPPVAEALDLQAHPEGGWYRRVWTAAGSVTTADGRERPTASVVQFYLAPGDSSAWHVVNSEELWIFNGGHPVTLQLGGEGPEPVEGPTTVVGPEGGQSLQALVPAGVWQRTIPASEGSLISCVVSPGFDFADFKLWPQD